MKDDEEHRLEIAAMRHRLIADALEAEGEGVSAALQQVAGRTHRDPDGKELSVVMSTLWRWLAAYRKGGLLGLRPKQRKDRRKVRAFRTTILERAARLRREKPKRPTKTVIDILVRKKIVAPGAIARSTLDRHLEHMGLSRRMLGTLAKESFGRIETERPFELLVGDFHHGPYVHVGMDDAARRALYGGFIDHFSRYVPEGRYYLAEDFAALRFGFRRLLVAHGLAEKVYLDNGPAYQSTRFAAACEALGIKLVHSKAYRSEGRGVKERFNRTLKEQFESEVRGREILPAIDELNAWFEAWLAERYHRDLNSETGEAPGERFRRNAVVRPAPSLDLVDEYLRLRERRTVHKKWSTVQVHRIRFSVHPSLRGRRVHVLFDPFDLSYVLISFDGRIVERAYPQKPGAAPPLPDEPAVDQNATDYLALLRADYERRLRTELSALGLQPAAAELDLPGLIAMLERCRSAALTDPERAEASAAWRRLRPIDSEPAQAALDSACRRLGTGLHLRIYLDALQNHLVRIRTKKGEKKS